MQFDSVSKVLLQIILGTLKIKENKKSSRCLNDEQTRIFQVSIKIIIQLWYKIDSSVTMKGMN